MNEKFRGVCAHKDGGWVVTLGRRYIGIFRPFELAVERRKEAEIEAYGQLLERREIEIEGDFARIPLHGRHGKFYGWAVVDIEDLRLVSPTAWTKDLRGYVVGRPAGRGNSITLHRLLMYGPDIKGGTTDHIDGDKMNNRRSNLRKCSPAENSRNTLLAKNNTSGFKGVRRTPEGRWKAVIWINYKPRHIGHYDTKEEAAAAYNAAALVLHGDFASPNTLDLLPA